MLNVINPEKSARVSALVIVSKVHLTAMTTGHDHGFVLCFPSNVIKGLCSVRSLECRPRRNLVTPLVKTRVQFGSNFALHCSVLGAESNRLQRYRHVQTAAVQPQYQRKKRRIVKLIQQQGH